MAQVPSLSLGDRSMEIVLLTLVSGLGLLIGVSVYSAVRLARETDRITGRAGDD